MSTKHDPDHPAGGQSAAVMEQSRARDADASAEPGSFTAIRALATDHPLAVLAGGMVAGMVIGALLPRSGTGRLTRKVGALAGVVGELGLAYARRAAAGAAEAAEAGSRLAGTVGERGSDLIGAAGDRIEAYSGQAVDTAEAAVTNLRQSAEGLARQVIRLTSHLRH